MNIRRRIAFWVCPELRREIVELARPIRVQPRVARTPAEAKQMEMADQLRTIARIFEVHRGKELCWWDIKRGRGAPINSDVVDYYDAYAVFAMLKRLRRDKLSGCREKYYFKSLALFSEKWPEDLEWPEGIPRPPKSEQKREVA
jgi:hypothetical protein